MLYMKESLDETIWGSDSASVAFYLRDLGQVTCPHQVIWPGFVKMREERCMQRIENSAGTSLSSQFRAKGRKRRGLEPGR